jgi:hypothetical protein
VQVFPPGAQVHPDPDIDTNDSPDGTFSVTVTVPLAGPAAALLLTTTEYVTPVCPCVKLPVWLLAMLSTGSAVMAVMSLAFAGADPPPITVAWLVTDAGAVAATFTVTAIAG